VGQSSTLKVGQQCLAIGNPFGFDHTLTVGIISGLNRDIFSQAGVTIGGGIQTDAAINPGNRFVDMVYMIFYVDYLLCGNFVVWILKLILETWTL
jgi:hypothetical protein